MSLYVPYEIGPEIPIPGGDGSHVIAWCLPEVGSPTFGLYERHWDASRSRKCGGMVQWRDYWPDVSINHVDHRLISGGPDQPIEQLTLSPSLLCPVRLARLHPRRPLGRRLSPICPASRSKPVPMDLERKRQP